MARNVGAKSEETSVRLQELQLEYDLAKKGLRTGAMLLPLTLLALIVGPLITGLTEPSFILSMVVIVVAGWVIYFAFVFRRVARIRASINETTQRLENRSRQTDLSASRHLPSLRIDRIV